MKSERFLTNTRLIIFVFGIVIIMEACKIGAGNIGFVTIVPHNLKKSIFLDYADSVMYKYNYYIPNKYDDLDVHYDHITVYNYYFKDDPHGIFILEYSDFLYVLYVEYPENKKASINSQTKLSKKEIITIQNRIIDKLLKPIEAMALANGLMPVDIYTNIKCESVIECK